MARFSRLEVLNEMVRIGLVPVFYHPSLEVAREVVSACAAGGARVVEFTNRGDNAYRIFSQLVEYFAEANPSVILGVGSVLDPGSAAMYIASGANFVVGPVLNPDVAKVCNRRKIPYSPGCGSASEISLAEELGVEIIKVFPGDSVGGPSFVKAILGPMPWTRIMPTGGVEATQESIEAWFKAGVAAVGIGSHLVRKEMVAARDYVGITSRTAQVLTWIRQARGKGPFLGVDHIGIYPKEGVSGETIRDWYVRTFDLAIDEGPTSWFLGGAGPGRVEVMKEGERDVCQVAVGVSDFEAAVASLQSKGIELMPPTIMANMKSVFLADPDPAGNIVHIVWRR